MSRLSAPPKMIAATAAAALACLLMIAGPARPETAQLSLNEGWNLVSLWFDSDQLAGKLESVQAKAWEYLTADKKYRLVKDLAGIEAGKAYWIYVPEDSAIELTDAVEAVSSDVNLDLKPGWNLIPNPFRNAFSFATSLQIDGEPALLSQKLRSFLYRFAGGEYASETISLDSEGAFWVKVDEPTQLTIETPTPSVCGNDMIEHGEQCDDGNAEDGDWCSSLCQIEPVCEGGGPNGDLYPDFSKFVSVGASMTSGVQDGSLLDTFMMYSPPAIVARMVEANFPQGQFHVFSDNPMRYTILDGGSIGYPDGSEIPRRLNLDEQIQNIAVPGAKVGDVLNTPGYSGPFPHAVILDPNLTLLDEGTQVKIAKSMDPTFIMSVDLAGNNMLTKQEWSRYASDYEETIKQLSETGATIMVANQPDATVLPYVSDESETWKANMRTLIEYSNEQIQTVVESYGGYIVDLYSASRKWATEGIDVDGVHLTSDFGGGIFSLDGLHLTSTGYSIMSNLFVDKINEVFNCRYPKQDLVETLNFDLYNPRTVTCAGVPYNWTCQYLNQ